MTAPPLRGPTPPWRLRVASYNIRKAVGLDWRRRPERILAVLDEIGPDVAVLQEADKRLGGRRTAIPLPLLASHGGFARLHSTPGPSIGWHGNAVLLRPGLSAEVIETLDLPGIEPRGAVVARVRQDDGAGEFVLVAAHLGLHLGSRHRQAAAILAATKGLGPALVLAGDLNDRAPARLLTASDRHLRVVTPGRTFHAARPIVALDHLVLEGAVRALDSQVHRSALARVASDHLPIWADLEVSAPPGP